MVPVESVVEYAKLSKLKPIQLVTFVKLCNMGNKLEKLVEVIDFYIYSIIYPQWENVYIDDALSTQLKKLLIWFVLTLQIN